MGLSKADMQPNCHCYGWMTKNKKKRKIVDMITIKKKGSPKREDEW